MSRVHNFEGDLSRFSALVEGRANDVWVGTAQECLRSIVEGSEITAAPGQPVGQYGDGYGAPGQVGGELKNSWQLYPEGDTALAITTDAPHAIPNEDGVSGTGGPYVQRSSVGGRHSVKLTIANFDKIVASEVRKVQTNALFSGRG